MSWTSVDDLDWEQWRPRQRATLLFIIRDERILLIHKKRGLGAGKINGAGGRLEAGETARQAACREMEEELLIRPLNPVQAGTLRFQFLDGLSLAVTVFRAAAYAGTPRETDEAKPLWADLDAIPYRKMWEDDMLWMPLMLHGIPFKGTFLFDGDRLLDARLDTI